MGVKMYRSLVLNCSVKNSQGLTCLLHSNSGRYEPDIQTWVFVPLFILPITCSWSSHSCVEVSQDSKKYCSMQV